MASSSSTSDETAVIEHQKIKPTTDKTLDFDLNYAYNLQLEEALLASLSLLPSSSNSPQVNPKKDAVSSFGLSDCVALELEKLEQERIDRELSEIEARKCREDFNRRVHDHKLALEITRLSEDEWDEFGDEIEIPFDEGCSSSSSLVNLSFRLYFKGLVSVERVGDSDISLTGIGVAIYDQRDNLVFELSKPLPGNGKNRQIAEIKALIAGLETAEELDLKCITIFCDYLPVYQYVRKVWQPKRKIVAMLMRKVEHLQEKFTESHPRLVARKDIQLAFKLARDAIVSQMPRPVAANQVKNLKETCVICLEEMDQDKMLAVDNCLHRYCLSCMKQHVVAKLHSGVVPNCPHESCESELSVKSCEKFLTSKLIKIMNQRAREASIPVTEKVYCPFPRCSALMSKTEVSDFANQKIVCAKMFGARQCVRCHGRFCINCSVPWHKNMSCAEYKRSHPFPKPEDEILKSLATTKLWRQCGKCNHMIELAEGCYHITCRCGYEFCYTCGAEWKNKKATCSCPLWDVENILFDDSEFGDSDSDFDEEEYDNSLSESDSDRD